MSFSTEVKNELCRVSMQRACCTRAEAYGALLHATVFSHREIRLSTENAVVARRLQALLQRAFFVVCEPQHQGRKYQIVLDQPAQIGRIFDVLGYDRKSHVTYHLNRNELEEDCCLASFLRGAFLMAGTVAGPDKKSHLELKAVTRALPERKPACCWTWGCPRSLRIAAAAACCTSRTAQVWRIFSRASARRMRRWR